MAALDSLTLLQSLLERWDRETSAGLSPATVLNEIACLVEKETQEWSKIDPDPFDDRHPGRADPTCSLGHVLKAIFKNDNFMNKLIGTYLTG